MTSPVSPITIGATTGNTPKWSVNVVPDAATAGRDTPLEDAHLVIHPTQVLSGGWPAYATEFL